jgi:hypothetical protein
MLDTARHTIAEPGSVFVTRPESGLGAGVQNPSHSPF